MKIIIERDTYIKCKPLPALDLADNQKVKVIAGDKFYIDRYEQHRGHYRCYKDNVIDNAPYFYVYIAHSKIDELSINKLIKLDDPFKSQLDNYYHPTGTCNMTSLAMVIAFHKPEYYNVNPMTQLEDKLYEYAQNNGLSIYDHEIFNQILQPYGLQSDFRTDTTLDYMKNWIAETGYPTIIAGYFTPFGHIIVVRGFDQEGLFVNDPYGEYFSSGYDTSLSGENLHYSNALITRTCIPDGKFFVHYITPNS